MKKDINYGPQANNKHKLLKYKQLLITLAFLMTGSLTTWAQTTWKPAVTAGTQTYYLKSTGNDNNFEVSTDGSSYSGDYTSISGGMSLASGCHITLIFENENPIMLNGQFYLNTNNCSVTLKKGSGSTANPTLKITGCSGNIGQAAVFFSTNSTSTDINNRKIIIEGNSDANSSTTDPSALSFANNFVIDGDGPFLTAVDGTSMAPKVKATSSGSATCAVKGHCLFRIQQGTLHLKNVTVQNFSTSYGNAGMIQVNLANATAAIDVEFNHCLFTSIGATSSSGSPVLRMQGSGGTNDNREARILNCKFVDIFGSGSLAVGQTTSIDNANATIRTLGNNKTKLKLDNCHITNNYGCPVRWHGCASAEPIVINNCLVENNFTYADNSQVYGGGGLLLKGPASITGCTIRNNRTNGNGGGIYLTTYVDFNSGTPDLIPEHSILQLDPNTKIYGNVAQQNGGGVAIEAQLMRNQHNSSITTDGSVIYYNPSGEPFKTQFIQNGGKVYGNNAIDGDGGGVYISRTKYTPFYKVECSLDFGEINNNWTGTVGYSQGSSDKGNGGGVAIKTYDQNSTVYSYTPPTEIEPQDVIVEISDPDLDPSVSANDMLVYGNKAYNGAGVYVEAFPITLNGVTSQVYVTAYATAHVQQNMASNNGGGLYVQEGTVRINGATIGGSTAAEGNTAGYNGGGIYVNNGTITTDVIPHYAESGGGGGGSGGGSSAQNEIPTEYANLYTQLEWISTNGGGYIDTGIPADADHTIYVDGGIVSSTSYILVATNGTTTTLLGAQLNSANLRFIWRRTNGDGYYSNSVYTYTTLGTTKDRVRLVMNKANLKVFKDAGGIATYTYTNTISAGLLGTGINWNLLKYGSDKRGKLYRAKIWDTGATINSDGSVTGTLLAEYIPCKRASDNAIGVFDLKNNTFIAGIGGTLTAGDPVRGSRGGASASMASNASSSISGRRGGTRTAVAGCTVSHNTATNDGGGIYLNNGDIFLMQSTVTYNTATNGRGGGAYTNAGNIMVNYWDPDDPSNGTDYSVRGETTASVISYNTAGLNGGGLNTHSGKVFMRGQTPSQDIVIEGNTATTGSGGGVFCNGTSSAEYIRFYNVNIVGNQALNGGGSAGSGVTAGCGGGIYLQQGIINLTKCELTENYAKVNGGGINNHAGSINIKGCIIGIATDDSGNELAAGNQADERGGGIHTQSGDIVIVNHTDGEQAFHTSKICYNTAGLNGGGVNTHHGKITATGDYMADGSRNILIAHNEASTGSGGGVFCMGISGSSDEYIVLRNVDLTDNKAADKTGTQTESGVLSGCGGGMYLKSGVINVTNVKMHNNYAKLNGGAINNHSGNINVMGCAIGGDTYYNNAGTGEGNYAEQNGGGIYTHAGDIDIQDHVVNLEGSIAHTKSLISHNEAAQNGGGINTHQGTITINFDISSGKEREDDHIIEVTYNKANKGGGIYANAGTIIAANAKIDNNTATENGGGINNHAGDITLYGGTLNNNTAKEGKGGGVFTMAGDIDIFPFPVGNSSPTLNDGTMIYNNIAKLNGGGINNHTGLVDVRHARLKNNTSSLGNGGGIFCEGPHSNSTGFTIRLLCSEVVNNKTRGQDGTEADPTGRGGGIYLKYGSIYAHASSILSNEANINGGGIDNHDGNMLLYGCDLIGNKAVTGKGGGIYTHSGDITTGPCIDRDEASKSRATVIQSNTAHVNGGGIDNHAGNIFLNGDHVLNNIAETGHGGGIYIANGTIDMYGGEIANNVAAKGDGGGVWSGGGTFNIQKREGKPIVEIVDVEVTGATTAKVHYHWIDKGGTTGTDIASHGIYWGSNENNVMATTVGNVASGVNTINSGHIAGDEAGCYRLEINTGGSGGETYYVKAFVTNDATPALSDTSNTIAFTTYSCIPVVITGSINEITTTAASVYAKLVYNGGSDITYRGIRYATSYDALIAESGDNYASVNSSDAANFFLTTIENTSNIPTGTKVYLRAFATNANGTGYGDTISFVTPKDLPTMSGTLSLVDPPGFVLENGKYKATFSYNMSTSGLTAYGFVISTDDDPELNVDNTVFVTVGEAFQGTFNGLESGTTYYVRAFASKLTDPGTDITNYGISTPVQYVTPDANGLPVVRASEISGITRNGATIHGEIVHAGTSNVKKYGVCYSTSSTTPTEHGTDCSHVDLTGNLGSGDTFTVNLADLTPNTTYYLRLYATNSDAADPAEADIAYSNPYNFSTLSLTPPTVEVNVINIANTSATVQCVVNDGGKPLTEYGIYFSGTSGSYPSAPTLSNNLGTAPNASNVYTVDLTGLTSNTTYYVKAYAKNGAGTNNDGTGTFEGREISFTTSYTKPTLSAVTVDAVNYDASTYYTTPSSDDVHTINVSGSITACGDMTPTEFGFVYSANPATQYLTIENESSEWDCGHVAVTAVPSENESVSEVLKERVNANKKYFIRTYAKTNGTYTYGNDISSVITLPTIIRGDVGTITNESAVLAGNIVSPDPEWHLREYGVIWKAAASTPTLTLTDCDGSVGSSITSATTTNRAFTIEATGLTSTNSYYWRAYVKNENGDIAYTRISEEALTPYSIGITTEAVPAEGGSVSGGTYCNSGTSVTLTATPATGYVFDHWTQITDFETNEEADLGNTNPLVIAANTTAHYKAYFKPTVSWVSNPTGGGTVTGSNSLSSGDAVAIGTSVTLTATAASGYTFTNWTDSEGNEVSTASSYTFTVNAPVSLTANFSDGRGASTQTSSLQNTTPRPRDIYPAPAREPWDWDEDWNEDWNEAPLCASPSLRGTKGESNPASRINNSRTKGESKSVSTPASRNNNMGSLPGSSLIPPTPLKGGDAYRGADVPADTLPEADSLDRLVEQLRNRDVTAPQDLPLIQYNQAPNGNGGGIYMTNSDPDNPTKLVFGGGEDDESKGKIIYNYAKEAGGGIYIDRNAYMQMKGHCEVNANWVPEKKLGGGIYLGGRLYLGDNKNADADKHALNVSRNFTINVDPNNATQIAAQITPLYTGTLTAAQKKQRNNVLLPRNTYKYNESGIYADPAVQTAHDDISSVITLLSDVSGKDATNDPYTKLGFTVISGFCPVIATAKGFAENYLNQGQADDEGMNFNPYHENGIPITSTPTEYYEKWLQSLMPGDPLSALTDDGSIFEDSETYLAVHTNKDLEPFRAKYIYLWGSWTNPAVSEDPENNTGPVGDEDQSMVGTGTHYKVTTDESGKTTWEIYSEEGLSWFSSYVNGLNAFTPGHSTDANPDPKHQAYEWDANKNPYAKATLMNDLDMSSHLWVPIGSVTLFYGPPNPANPESPIYTDGSKHDFRGEFDGRGHIIKGLDGRFLTGITQYGLFGHLSENAKVSNVFVDESQFISDKADQYFMGGISGVMEGNAILKGAEARALIDISSATEESYAGGLVGQVKDGTSTHAVIHSSMAMPEIIGKADYIGGLVGYLGTNDTLVNSFSNPKFSTEPATGKYLGGLVGVNKGLVENCYARLQEGSKETGLGWLAGTNNGTVKYSYAPKAKIDGGSLYKQVGDDPTGHGTYDITTRNEEGKYSYNHHDQNVEASNEYKQNSAFGGLLTTLNNWVRKTDFDSTEWTNKHGYAQWSRTMASTINDDYPVLMLDGLRSLGSADGIYIHYTENLDQMVKKYNEEYPVSSTVEPVIFVYDVEKNAVSSTVSNNDNVQIVIDEHVGITQAESTNLQNVRVGVTVDNSSKGAGDWHFFSSSLASVPLGLEYHTLEKRYENYTASDGDYIANIVNKPLIPHSIWSDRTQIDPPKTTWSTSAPGYFPTDTPYGTWRPGSAGGQNANDANVNGYFDFYCFMEEGYHWINFKREGTSEVMDHWHEDVVFGQEEPIHYKLPYENELTFIEGKGYLVAFRDTTMLMADGMLNNGPLNSKASYSSDAEIGNWPVDARDLRACNLIGNPYQSYLDFTEFARVNESLIVGGVNASYAVMDQDSSAYIYYVARSSYNGITAPPYLHPMQAFFVRTTRPGTFTFTNDMRGAGKWNPGKIEKESGLSHFRDLRPNYPLVNLICTDSDGKRDYTTVETARPDEGGGQKMPGLHSGNALIYAHYDNTSYQTVFTPVGTSEVPVRFRAIEDDDFTMRWNTFHGDFSYLHLIDNITGMDIDMLTNTEYRFQGKTTDYKSRFKLVFNCTGIEEDPADDETNTSGTKVFAFQSGDELVVNGEGYLQMFDLNGRCLMATYAAGAQSSIAMPNVAAGVYVLRLTENNQTKIQKMIIK